VAQVRSKLAYYGAALLALAAAGTLVGTRILHGSSRDRLRLIVQQQCLPDWLLHHNPAPCRTIKLMGSDRDAPGFAVMPDRKGGAHFLLIPTRAIRGIESPELRARGALNYYAAAWTARDAARIGSDWSPLQIAGQWYQAMRVMGTGLGAANPFALLAGRSVPGAELLLDSSCAVAR
jgi:CDP-diacylglycerol pyrophosphatase